MDGSEQRRDSRKCRKCLHCSQTIKEILVVIGASCAGIYLSHNCYLYFFRYLPAFLTANFSTAIGHQMLLMVVFFTMNWCLNLLAAFYWLTLTQKQRNFLSYIFKCKANTDFRKRLMQRSAKEVYIVILTM